MKTIFNNCLIKAEFPNKLKLADVTQILKKEDPSRAKNYRPVRVLPSVSNIFERILHRQVSSSVGKFLSTFICAAIEKALCTTSIIIAVNRKMGKYFRSKWTWWCNTYGPFKGF